MRTIGAEHVNQTWRQLTSLFASFAVAATLFRFTAAHVQRERHSVRPTRWSS